MTRSPAPTELPSAPLLDHLEELRRRLFYSLLFLGLGMAVAFQYRLQLIAWLKGPLRASEQYRLGNVQLVTVNLTDQFLLSLQLSFWAGLALSLPFILWQVWAFIAPGLYAHERRWALPFIVGAGLSFLGGAAFGYVFVLPAMVRFLLDFLGGTVEQMQNLANYIGLLTGFLVAFGLAFELPILAVILTRIGLVNHVMLRRAWRLALIGVLLFAAFITPTPDPFNMLLVAGPLYALYELGILLSRLFRVVPPVEEEAPLGA
ncbi:preprotein translocase subunit TatC [Deinococcus sp. RL]|uniref:twin-arginine translocase subunit TatC n=1 Tax=Deinococcus sp. RL TaxID=1489678 RepID=UPI0004D71207|nr:twin-arginine translocase subunit TatC [Deinococcus sp. RL]KEF33524.1 preprotein translocase subunit TatC [Deinococcus sp. RL]